MNNFYQQQASYNAPPSPSYHQNVQNYNTVQSGPDMNYRQSGRDRHFPLRSSLQRSDASRNHWEEQANLNTTHAAEALRHLGGSSTGRPDTTGPNFSGYASINDGNLNNRQSDNRDHSQSGTVAYSYFQAEHPQNDLSSANRQSDNHFTSILPGRDVIKQGQQDPQHRAFATSNLANISSIDHRSGFPAQNGPNLIGLGRRLQPDNASQAYVTQSRQVSNEPRTANAVNDYISNHAASATRTLPPVTSVNREVASNRLSNNNQGPSHVHPSHDHGQRSTTVDPTEVYNPWQEYQRRQAAAQEAAEKVRQEEASTKDRENKSRRAERSAVEHTEIIRKNVNQLPGSSAQNGFRGSLHSNEVISSRERSDLSSTPISGQTSNVATSAKEEVEAEVKAMMSKLRELSSKDPALLAQIWDQERKFQTSSKLKENTTESHEVSNTFPIVPMKEASTNVANNAAPSASKKSQPASRVATPQIYRTNGASAIVGEEMERPKGANMITNRPSVGTEWPPEKKVHVATAVSEYLNNYPGNKGKKISPEEVSALLDSNPSYIELCEILETRGFMIARGVLARTLLSAVPDINSTTAASRSPALKSDANHIIAKGNEVRSPISAYSHVASGSINSNSRYSESAEGSNGASARHRETSSNSVKSHPNKISEPRTSVQNKLENSTGHNQKSKNIAHAPPNAPKPMSKEEAARKRDYAEIVDLSLLSDEEIGPPSKKVATESDQQPLHVDGLASQDLGALQAVQDFLHPTQKITTSNTDEAVPIRPQPKIVVDNKIKNVAIANDIDEKKALRRTTYNVTTIARDVLLATGKHPEMARLNAHLEPLLSTFRKLYLTSDLSTLRWDIIDPGNPQPDTYADPDYMSDSTTDEMENGQVMVSSVQMATSHGENTFLQRINSHASTNIGKPVFKRKKGRPPSSTHAAVKSRPYEQYTGRQPSTYTPSTPSAGRNNIPVTTPSSVPTSGSGDSSTVRPSSYTAFRQAMASDGTPLPRKKGRPVGWRKYPAASSTPGSASTQQPSKLRYHQTANEQQNRAVQKDQDSSSAPKPHFCVYKCLWKGCVAELHNLDTLSKHVSKIHLKPGQDGNYKCFWATCGKVIKDTDMAIGEETERIEWLSFSSEYAIKAHIEKAHLSIVAWSLGDGPAAGLSDAHESDASDPYLSDNLGRRVTPLAVAPQLSNDPQPLVKRGPGRLKKSEKDTAIEEQKAVERKKRDIGPGIDRGGATLANPKRRTGFIDDEEFEEIVENN